MDKADFVGAWTVSAGIVQALLAAANNRGQQAFNLLAPYGDTTTTPPLTTAQMAQTYTLDAAAVEVVVQGLAIRGHEFLTALATLATPGGGAGNPSIQETNPNVYRATGTGQGGTVITFNLAITDPDGQVDNQVVPITLPPGQHSGATVVGVCAATLEPLPHIRAVASGNTLTLSPADPDYSLDSSVSVT